MRLEKSKQWLRELEKFCGIHEITRIIPFIYHWNGKAIIQNEQITLVLQNILLLSLY